MFTQFVSSLNEQHKESQHVIDITRHSNRLIKEGDVQAAIQLLSDALLTEPNSYILHGNRSAAYAKAGQFQRALQDAIRARELNPCWAKAYHRQGIALHGIGRHADALAAFASGLSQDSKSAYLLAALLETAMKSPFRASLEPIYRNLQSMQLDKSPFVVTSVVGQELLADKHLNAAVVVLESSLRIGTCSMKLKGSVYSALSTAYWELGETEKALQFMQSDLQVRLTYFMEFSKINTKSCKTFRYASLWVIKAASAGHMPTWDPHSFRVAHSRNLSLLIGINWSLP